MWRAMVDAFVSPSRRWAFELCSQSHWLMKHRERPDEFKSVLCRCNDRWCVPCARLRAARICTNLRPALQGLRLRLLTLTLRHTDTPLRDQLALFYTSWRKLRGSAYCRRRITSSFAVLELKVSDTDDRWHPHLHVIWHGRYLHHPVIRDRWAQVTGGSSIVDLRELDSPRHALRYVTKYVTKAVSHTVYHDPDKLAEAIDALTGRRMLIVSGAWRSLHLTADPAESEWTVYGHENDVRNWAADGDSLAAAVLAAYHAAADDPSPVFIARAPPPLPDSSPNSEGDYYASVA